MMKIINGYASHLPILEGLMDANGINTVIETGMGDFSTRLFCERGCDLTSIEMQNRPWYEKIEKKYKGDNRIFLILLNYRKVVDLIKSPFRKPFDLLMVDGHEQSRRKIVETGIGKAKYIVAHDSEAQLYEYHKIKLPDGYVWIDFEMEKYPWTGLVMREGLYGKNRWIVVHKHTIYRGDLRYKKYVHYVK